MTLTVALIVALLPALAQGRIPAHQQKWQYRYQVWMPAVWQRLARCESGSNPPNWRHDSGTYQGAFGFYHGSWDAFRPSSYPSNAADATPWQQLVVARRIHARFGFSGWGCAKHAWVMHG